LINSLRKKKRISYATKVLCSRIYLFGRFHLIHVEIVLTSKDSYL
jgi:hypothetical protein